MGIRGLSSFFDNNDSFFEEVRLSDTEIVIDGSNLLYVLKDSCRGLNCAYGGEYRKLYQHFKDYFQTLLNCGISPILLFDGGDEEIKKKTRRERSLGQILCSLKCSVSNQHKFAMNATLAKDLFVCVCHEMGITVIQTEFEADRDIAMLAMKKKCPVLSNDSDFFIFSVDFVRLNSINLFRTEEEGKLVCEKFNRQKFLEHYHLKSEDMLHLLASLIGNDYISISTIEAIFSNIKMDKKKKNCSERHRKIGGLLKFLARYQKTEEALNQILSCYNLKERPGLKSKVEDSINMYSGANSSFTELSEAECLPQELRILYRDCKLPRLAVSVNTMDFIILSAPQVECLELPSVQMSSLPILKTSISLLIKEERSLIIKGRVNKSLGVLEKLETKPILLTDLSEKDRINLMYKTLNCVIDCPALNQLPPEYHGLYLIINYWCQSYSITESMIVPLLLHRFVSVYVDPKVNYERNPNIIKKKLDSSSTPSTEKPYLTCMLNFATFFHGDANLKTSDKGYDRHLVHRLNDLQFIYMRTMELNYILDEPVQIPKIHHFYSGKFIYKMTKFLYNRKHSVLSDGKYLPDDCAEEFVKVKNIMLANLKVAPSTKVFRVRVRKEKKVETPLEIVESEREDTSDNSTSSDEGIDSEICSDLSNRFALLRAV